MGVRRLYFHAFLRPQQVGHSKFAVVQKVLEKRAIFVDERYLQFKDYRFSSSIKSF